MEATTDLTEDDLHVLRHMLGINDARKPPRPYRNHYCANAGDDQLERLERLGMVRVARRPNSWLDFVTYAATEEGRAAAMRSATERLVPKKKRVYLLFLDVRDTCPDLSFREFLTSPDFADVRRDA